MQHIAKPEQQPKPHILGLPPAGLWRLQVNSWHNGRFDAAPSQAAEMQGPAALTGLTRQGAYGRAAHLRTEHVPAGPKVQSSGVLFVRQPCALARARFCDDRGQILLMGEVLGNRA